MNWQEKLDRLSELGRVEIGYRSADFREELGLEPFHISARGVEVKQDGMLVSYHGNGNTVEEAVEDYWTQIVPEILVTNAYSDYREEWRWSENDWKRINA